MVSAARYTLNQMYLSGLCIRRGSGLFLLLVEQGDACILAAFLEVFLVRFSSRRDK